MSESKVTVVDFGGKRIDFALSVGRKIKGKSAGSDLGDLENGPINDMFLDPEVMATVVWNCFDDCFEGIYESFSEFANAMKGDLLKNVTAAIRAAIIDFFIWGGPMIEQVEAGIQKLATMNPSDLSGPMSIDSQQS